MEMSTEAAGHRAEAAARETARRLVSLVAAEQMFGHSEAAAGPVESSKLAAAAAVRLADSTAVGLAGHTLVSAHTAAPREASAAEAVDLAAEESAVKTLAADIAAAVASSAAEW